jgi:hypothetical protein
MTTDARIFHLDARTSVGSSLVLSLCAGYQRGNAAARVTEPGGTKQFRRSSAILAPSPRKIRPPKWRGERPESPKETRRKSPSCQLTNSPSTSSAPSSRRTSLANMRPEILSRGLETFAQRNSRFPTQSFLRDRNVGPALPGIILGQRLCDKRR